jgi:hypothetical protein
MDRVITGFLTELNQRNTISALSDMCARLFDGGRAAGKGGGQLPHER